MALGSTTQKGSVFQSVKLSGSGQTPSRNFRAHPGVGDFASPRGRGSGNLLWLVHKWRITDYGVIFRCQGTEYFLSTYQKQGKQAICRTVIRFSLNWSLVKLGIFRYHKSVRNVKCVTQYFINTPLYQTQWNLYLRWVFGITGLANFPLGRLIFN